MAWTDESIERVMTLWNKGLTATEIGEICGMSRGTIMGKISRLRDKGNSLPNRTTSNVAAPKKFAAPTVKSRAAKGEEKQGEQLPPLPISPPPLPQELPLINGWNSVVSEVYQLKMRECRFPLGEPMTGFCRLPLEKFHTSYCAYHQQLTHKKL